MKTKSKRSKTKYPALDPKLNLRSRRHLIEDFDYIDKLSESEKKYLNNFVEESVNANLKHEGRKLHKHRKHIKAIYRSNNDRNKCIYTKETAYSALLYLEDLSEKKSLGYSVEDQIINKIDNEVEIKKVLEFLDTKKIDKNLTPEKFNEIVNEWHELKKSQKSNN